MPQSTKGGGKAKMFNAVKQAMSEQTQRAGEGIDFSVVARASRRARKGVRTLRQAVRVHATVQGATSAVRLAARTLKAPGLASAKKAAHAGAKQAVAFAAAALRKRTSTPAVVKAVVAEAARRDRYNKRLEARAADARQNGKRRVTKDNKGKRRVIEMSPEDVAATAAQGRAIAKEDPKVKKKRRVGEYVEKLRDYSNQLKYESPDHWMTQVDSIVTLRSGELLVRGDKTNEKFPGTKEGLERAVLRRDELRAAGKIPTPKERTSNERGISFKKERRFWRYHVPKAGHSVLAKLKMKVDFIGFKSEAKAIEFRDAAERVLLGGAPLKEFPKLPPGVKN